MSTEDDVTEGDTTNNVIDILSKKRSANPFPAQRRKQDEGASVCRCGSTWFVAHVMFSGGRLLAYSRRSVMCASCGRGRA